MAERHAGESAGYRIEFRIGINLGDVVVEEGDIFGDGVRGWDRGKKGAATQTEI
jgi:adenylate cyclase